MFIENFAINILSFVLFAPVIFLLLDWFISQVEEIMLMTSEDWFIMLGFFGIVAIITLINL
tara:strand:+ start:320 stop:502 length:183 start_codon:yes stop_codon:yes gene_type:complete